MFFYLDIPRLSWGFSTPNMLAAFLTILLGLTYSRGGYLAWLTVLAVYYFIARRKKVFVCLLTFVAILAVIPAENTHDELTK